MLRFKRRGFWSILEKLEKTFIRLLVIGFAFVALFHVIIPSFVTSDLLTRSVLLNDSLEGEKYLFKEEPIENAMKTKDHMATVTLKIESYSSMQKAKILVNDQPVGDFQNNLVSIGVNTGDKLAIDGSFYKRSFTVKIVKTSENLRVPKSNQQFLIHSNKVVLGHVELEE